MQPTADLHHTRLRRAVHGDDGQSTTEYALIVVLVAAIVAGVMAVWPGALKDLFEAMVDIARDKVGGK